MFCLAHYWVSIFSVSSPAPVYANTPTLVKNGSLAVIDWTNSFVLNGRLREYILRADNILMTRGVKTAYGVQRTSKDGGEVHTLSVCVFIISLFLLLIAFI